ncbi:hypothetical protein P7K49_003170 [Saguinus oedipus]|uniref:Uncharacterized protein n=1 Tax=Saguinus oedipus TaxID=9490 RepID=A0ABQ9WJE6_SAGOE|nr:hypothetical protein P7K49_003170 [Saguinus oedipus]
MSSHLHPAAHTAAENGHKYQQPRFTPRSTQQQKTDTNTNSPASPRGPHSSRERTQTPTAPLHPAAHTAAENGHKHQQPRFTPRPTQQQRTDTNTNSPASPRGPHSSRERTQTPTAPLHSTAHTAAENGHKHQQPRFTPRPTQQQRTDTNTSSPAAITGR